LDELKNSERIKLIQTLLAFTTPKYGTRPAPPHPDDIDLPLFIEIEKEDYKDN
jgi:hypothetical protein